MNFISFDKKLSSFNDLKIYVEGISKHLPNNSFTDIYSEKAGPLEGLVLRTSMFLAEYIHQCFTHTGRRYYNIKIMTSLKRIKQSCRQDDVLQSIKLASNLKTEIPLKGFKNVLKIYAII